MPFFSSKARARLALRQSSQGNNTCTTNEGVGECIPRGHCRGASTAGICAPETDDIECCLVRICNVPEGHGVCRSVRNNGCENGRFFTGTGRPWPCPGPEDIRCCVKFVDFNNGTNTMSSSLISSQTQTISASTQSATSSSVPSQSGLNGGQIGGIAAGCASFALLTVIGALFFMRRRRKEPQPTGEKSETSDSGISEMPDSAGIVPRAPKTIVANELDGKEKQKFPKELDSTPIPSPVELDASPIEAEKP